MEATGSENILRARASKFVAVRVFSARKDVSRKKQLVSKGGVREESIPGMNKKGDRGKGPEKECGDAANPGIGVLIHAWATLCLGAAAISIRV